MHRYRVLMVLSMVNANDYLCRGVRAIVHSVLGGARPGAIILMHDTCGDRSQTAHPLPKIISTLRGRGYSFVTVPQLGLANPPPHNQQIFAILATGVRAGLERRLELGRARNIA
jgi:peptidoglycan/xylan/chitin deacetylase (PgdA/CDA1 family)